MRFKGKQILRVGLLITFVVPVFATIIALYQLFGSWDLLDKKIGLISIYASSFFPLNVWMLSNYFSSLPRELEEAAWLDGCTRFQSMWKVILPLSYPVLFTSALIIFLIHVEPILNPTNHGTFTDNKTINCGDHRVCHKEYTGFRYDYSWWIISAYSSSRNCHLL